MKKSKPPHPRCGSTKTATGKPCRQTSRLRSGGPCHFHSGDRTTARSYTPVDKRRTLAGIYSTKITADEAELIEWLDDGTLDGEIKMVSLALLRLEAVYQRAENGEAPPLAEVLSELKVVPAKGDDPGGAKPSKLNRVARWPDYYQTLIKLTARLQSLKKQRHELQTVKLGNAIKSASFKDRANEIWNAQAEQRITPAQAKLLTDVMTAHMGVWDFVQLQDEMAQLQEDVRSVIEKHGDRQDGEPPAVH